MSDRTSQPRARRRVSAVKRALVAGLTGLAAVGGVAMSAQPAEAASAVSACFRFAAPFNGNYSEGVQLQMWTTAGWQTVAYGRAGSSGCASWTISGSLRSYYLQVLAYKKVGSALYMGTSPLMAVPGNLRANLGTGIVRCRGAACV